MFLPRCCISLRGGWFLLLHTYLNILSIHLCSLLVSFRYHVLVLQSNRIALSTHVCATLAWVLFVILACFSCFFILLPRYPLLLILFFRSHGPSISMFLPSSLTNSKYSSLLSLFCSSKVFITLFTALAPPSISSFVPIMVVSSAKREIFILMDSASLLKFSHSFGPGS